MAGEQEPVTIGLPADVDAVAKATEGKAEELSGNAAITHVVVHTAAAEEEDGKQPEMDQDEKEAGEKRGDKPATGRMRRISSTIPPPYHLENDVDAAIPNVISEAQKQTAKEVRHNVARRLFIPLARLGPHASRPKCQLCLIFVLLSAPIARTRAKAATLEL